MGYPSWRFQGAFVSRKVPREDISTCHTEHRNLGEIGGVKFIFGDMKPYIS